jgi:hypothetical protein
MIWGKFLIYLMKDIKRRGIYRMMPRSKVEIVVKLRIFPNQKILHLNLPQLLKKVRKNKKRKKRIHLRLMMQISLLQTLLKPLFHLKPHQKKWIQVLMMNVSRKLLKYTNISSCSAINRFLKPCSLTVFICKLLVHLNTWLKWTVS